MLHITGCGYGHLLAPSSWSSCFWSAFSVCFVFQVTNWQCRHSFFRLQAASAPGPCCLLSTVYWVLCFCGQLLLALCGAANRRDSRPTARGTAGADRSPTKDKSKQAVGDMSCFMQLLLDRPFNNRQHCGAICTGRHLHLQCGICICTAAATSGASAAAASAPVAPARLQDLHLHLHSGGGWWLGLGRWGTGAGATGGA
jgi:hypothetical protein